MAARARAQREPIRVGDIVRYRGPRDEEPHAWDVIGRGMKGDTPTLALARDEQRKAATPYGKPQRYKRVRVTAEAPEGRCILVARQQPMFELEPAAGAGPGGSIFSL
jgi:hypothetical protein